MSDTKELSLAQYVNQESVIKNVQETLKDRTPQFITSMISLVNSNEALKQCDKKSIMSACLTAAALNLPVNQSLGMAYIIPYGGVAQFQIGWKGLVDLAVRTERYKHINATDVREGEVGKRDPLKGTINFNWIDDEVIREKTNIVGYVAYFELKEGFEKMLYMTNEQLEAHALKYSQSYRKNSPKMNQWRDDRPGMSKKTVIKLLINRFGPKNADLRRAIDADQSAIDGQANKYVDNQPVMPEEISAEKERNRLIRFIEKATTISELDGCLEALEAQDQEVNDMYQKKLGQLVDAQATKEGK